MYKYIIFKGMLLFFAKNKNMIITLIEKKELIYSFDFTMFIKFRINNCLNYIV